jgi:hypothetical protein
LQAELLQRCGHINASLGLARAFGRERRIDGVDVDQIGKRLGEIGFIHDKSWNGHKGNSCEGIMSWVRPISVGSE